MRACPAGNGKGACACWTPSGFEHPASAVAPSGHRCDVLPAENRSRVSTGARDDIAVHVSIRLGAMIVFAADEAGLAWLMERLPKDDHFPMKLNQHAAFHSPLLNHIVPEAKALNARDVFGVGAISAIDGNGFIWSPKAFNPDEIYDYTLGAQIEATYDFTRAVQVAAREFCPDRVVVLGPGTTLGAPVAQALIGCGWRGLSGKADFQARQTEYPLLISMGMADQRAYVTAN